ncbi:MAG TPA: nucleoside triphosphate pyrophosphatase [Kofleriaceae bacterium]|nr:nucleoside triphosphate pyrophosphatase [Kofleriaceae bacterium]
MLPLLLASASPRRRELLERVGVPLEVHPADVDEEPTPDEDPSAYVARIAKAKAIAVKRRPGQWVLAADTTVTIDGKILAKAATPDEAAGMLGQLAGRVHQVITAFTIIGDGPHDEPLRRDGIVSSDVVVIDLDAQQIADYVASGEWRGKAGAYAVQGIGAALVREVRGSVTNVIGLPLVEVLEALRAVGAPSAKLAAGIPA